MQSKPCRWKKGRSTSPMVETAELSRRSSNLTASVVTARGTLGESGGGRAARIHGGLSNRMGRPEVLAESASSSCAESPRPCSTRPVSMVSRPFPREGFGPSWLSDMMVLAATRLLLIPRDFPSAAVEGVCFCHETGGAESLGPYGFLARVGLCLARFLERSVMTSTAAASPTAR